MPTYVTDEDMARFKAKLALAGQPLKPDWNDWHKEILQIPLIDVKKTQEKPEPRKLITTFSIKLRYNMKGRKKTKYNEWPMMISSSSWALERLVKVGLIESLEEATEKTKWGNKTFITKAKIYGDAPDAYAIYDKDRAQDDMWRDTNWLLREYEGSIH